MPLSLLVGPAGAGKSNLLRGLQLLQNSIHRTLSELFPPGLGEFQWVRSRWARTTDPITFEVDVSALDGFPGEQARYRIEIADAPQGLYIVKETLQRRCEQETDWRWVFERKHRPGSLGEFGYVDPYEPSILYKVWHAGAPSPRLPVSVAFARAVARVLSSFGYFHLEVSELKSLGSGNPAERIGYYGGGLPDFVAWAKSKPEGVDGLFDQILAKMKEILPELDDLLVTQVGEQQGLAIQCKGHNGYITARDLSDGTLLTLGLLSILLSPRRPSVLCLEEPETGLHPRRLRWLFEHLIGIAYPKGGERRTQVVLTTHSPDLVNLFSDMTDSIFVIEAKNGRSRVRPLLDIIKQLGHNADTGQSIGHAWATGLYEGL